MDISITNQAELLGEFRNVHDKIEAAKHNTEAEIKRAHDKAAAEFGEKLRAMEERQAFAGRQAAAPVGGEAALVSRFTRSDGSISLVRSVERVQFAGQSVDVVRDGLFTDSPATPWDAELKQLALAATIYRSVTGRAPVTLRGRLLAHAAKAPTAGGFRAALEKTLVKSISDTAASGAEWIPDTPISALYEDYFTANGIAALFSTVNINGPIIVPKITDTGRPYLKGKASTNDPDQYTASDVTSDSQTIEAAGFAARFIVDDAATEDAIFALAPEIARRAARAIADGYEDCMINGDTAASHQDAIATWNLRSRWGATGLGGSGDHRRGFLGLRALAVDRSCTVDLTASQTASGVMGSVVGAMGELSASDIALITSPEVLYKKLMVDSSVLTVDKMGAAATILTGQLASIGGHPLFASRWMGADLASTGLYTGSGALSGLVAVSRGEFAHYQSRSVMVEQDKDITRGIYNIVATQRKSMRTLSSSGQKVVFYAYNML